MENILISANSKKNTLYRNSLNHVAIIVDGTRRWASNLGLSQSFGHDFAFLVSLPQIFRYFLVQGITRQTFFCCSVNNVLKRSPDEVSNFLKRINDVISVLTDEMILYGIKFKMIGNRELIPQYLLEKVEKTEELTSSGEKGFLCFAIAYSGADEIARACKKSCEAQSNDFRSITPDMIDSFLDTADLDLPSPDLVLRTSGDIRFSGFMPLQTAYSEWFFIDKAFQDLTYKDLDKVIDEFRYHRRRRHGI